MAPPIVGLVIVLSPFIVQVGTRIGRTISERLGGAKANLGLTGDTKVSDAPPTWARWNGARPELRGAPLNTILNYPHLSDTTPEFRKALLDTAEQLAIPVDSLALIMSHESGFNPKAHNPLPASGLIQLTVGAKLPGFSTKEAIDEVVNMPAAEQLDKIVIPYYARMGDVVKNGSPGTILMANFLPKFLGKPEDTVMGECPPELVPFIGKPKEFARAFSEIKEPDNSDSKKGPDGIRYRKLTASEGIYCWNPGMDFDRDGKITVGDVYQDAANIAKRAKGQRMRIDGTILTPGATTPSAGSTGATASLSGSEATGSPGVTKDAVKVTGGTPAGQSSPVSDSASSGGIMLRAILDGTAILPPWVEVTLPSGLIVTCMRDAMVCPVGGHGLQRMPVSYAETIIACKKLDCLPLTPEVSDLLWKMAPVHVRPIGLVQSASDAAHMATIEWSVKHNLNISNPANNTKNTPVMPGDFIGDPGKDWVLDAGIKVKGAVNYGWRDFNGKPTQSLGHAHDEAHWDYSQVFRAMQRAGMYQGQQIELLSRPELWLPPGFPSDLLAPLKIG